ncbi:MAG: MBL fold metallo-hydrolase [Candidatus Faecousia sp.]|nr:MBL fold metallo-hydrolase [Clostridiales bacterium]MDY4598379.1 MBL fold metallo-hydrolase [Candidatus Faecousia sp.]
MLQVHALTLGAYQVNCYIIHDEKSPSCCVIDPGYEADTIVDKLSQLGLTLEAILLTHGHFDHVGAVRDLAADTGCQVWLCADDLALPTNLTAGPLCYTNTYAEGTGLHLAGLDISVLQTPGHTPGSVCLLAENTLFSGDTLFAGSCGRTDLPGGSWEQMQSSLKRLAGIEANLWVLPGHGESTTLDEEKRHNPYLH